VPSEINHAPHQPPDAPFDGVFREQLDLLLRSRRDVRHFRADPVDPALVQRLLEAAMLAPSVGFSQPWRWVLVNNPALRAALFADHVMAKDEAGQMYEGERSSQYRGLKLSGMQEAPLHIAVFADCSTGAGHGLGTQTMPGTLLWSVVMVIYALWLKATAEGLGAGWVSILHAAKVAAALDVPEHWTFVAYLCIGWPEEYASKPLLETAGWETRLRPEECVYNR